MSRLRVLHCIYDDPANPWIGGGGALRVFEIYRRLSDRIDATVATGAFPGARDETIEGVRYLRLGLPRPYPLSRLTYGAAATRMLRRAAYDVAVFDFSGYTPIRLPAGRPTAIVVHMLHGATSAGRWGRTGASLLRAVEAAMLRRTREICVTSRWLERELAGLVVPDARFHLVRSGVPDEFFAVDGRGGAPFLYYGRFDVYQKGLDLLLDAWAELAATPPAPPLRMLGRGKDADAVRAMIADRGLEALVTLHENPSRVEVIEAMAGARALVHPSRFEGLPMVPAEAMATGLPVIATDVAGVGEVVGEGGILIPAHDRGAIAGAVRRLAADDAARSALVPLARASAARFRWHRVADEHHAFLQAVAGAAPIGPDRSRR